MRVFISHQRSDKDEAKKVADYLERCGIDVYFDKYDQALQQAWLSDNPKGVVDAIKSGVQSSTHMLVLVSPNTLRSEWVPFEIGYGYDNLSVLALTLKGILTKDIPDYVKVVPIIRDIYDIDKFATEKGNRYLMESRHITKDTGYERHPLYGIMDNIITS
ncbi:MAG: toll/interleukin-1 receptor domain-containing protein [Candidatus Sedimenticola sp. (ex Thyasira tokunagai)]